MGGRREPPFPTTLFDVERSPFVPAERVDTYKARITSFEKGLPGLFRQVEDVLKLTLQDTPDLGRCKNAILSIITILTASSHPDSTSLSHGGDHQSIRIQ